MMLKSIHWQVKSKYTLNGNVKENSFECSNGAVERDFDFLASKQSYNLNTNGVFICVSLLCLTLTCVTSATS